MEEWKDIEGFEGYQISNKGRVKSCKFGKEKILKAAKNNSGYLLVDLYKDGKQAHKQIHRLVAEAFIPNPQNLLEVNHKDEDKTNNCVENLEFCDKKYNVNYGSRNQRHAEKLSKRVDQIDKVTGEVVHQWESTKEAGRNGYDQGAVSHCARGEYGYKTYKGFIWKYIKRL